MQNVFFSSESWRIRVQRYHFILIMHSFAKLQSPPHSCDKVDHKQEAFLNLYILGHIVT